MVEEDPDAELMERVATGDRAAFALLFDRYQASVSRFAYRFVGSQARAEELTQDVFVKLFQSARRYRRTARFKTFLFRIAANHCLNALRRKEGPMPDQKGHSQGQGEGERPDEALFGRELEAAVAQALDDLSERERLAFVMCRFEGLAYKEIATVLSATEAAVKSLIHRATLAVARKVDALQAANVAAGSRS
jgi:RNA polymerase sigma-70 factor, ECF subfamily